MIIFWRGRGAAIILFSLLGVVAVMMVASSIGADFKSGLVNKLSLWGAVAGAWLFAKTWGKPVEKQVFDPQMSCSFQRGTVL